MPLSYFQRFRTWLQTPSRSSWKRPLAGIVVLFFVLLAATLSDTHVRAIQAVHKGLVDAAFVSSSRLDEAIRQGSFRTDEVAVFWKSSPIPVDPFVYRGRLCPPLVERIKMAFFSESAVLQDMFRALGQEGFVEVNDDHYLGIREIFSSPP
ncbi:MAG: PhnD/SsuA/transferrin family substrate-binding protein [Propionivibrio sp.]|uniref:PhnD/SsuA/transferrin family substrate-binding protein n=1 Tax=Propionivibrio sp. TaxID=2212460 RepID=UPI001A42AB12|nr:PhnD/SsuA/transferrin family substrate-binding protein [Propionivibrio sp.]MBL8412976.1 PhnD/SsuA/transferrin family substrate-binding protein [Propionivibrio sp.]